MDQNKIGKQLQLDTEEESDLLEKVLLILKTGITILNRKGLITFMNLTSREYIKRESGINAEVGEVYLDCIPEIRNAMVTACIDDAFGNKETVLQVSVTHNNEEVWLETGFYPMADKNGFVTNICIKERDVTSQVVLQKKLEKQITAEKENLMRTAAEAQEKERAMIGRELHDNINQVLTTVKLYNELCFLEETTNKVMLQKSIQQLNYCIDEIRKLSHRLTDNPHENSLAQLLQELADSVNRTQKMDVAFFTYGTADKKLTEEIQKSLLRVAQEQLNNIFKHADASLVEMILVATSSNIALRIHDNGRGFDLTASKNGLGFGSMRSRVESLGGHLDIDSAPGNGCSLMVEIPLQSN